MNQDTEHLRLLSIFHFIVGGLIALFAFFPIFYVILGVFMLIEGFTEGGDGAGSAMFGMMFISIASIYMILGWGLAVCLILAGRYISQRKHHTFCLITAIVGCLFIPLGTILGVLSIIVLSRRTVKDLFECSNSATADFPPTQSPTHV